MDFTVVPASGGMEQFKNVLKHKVDFGFTMSSMAYKAWKGIDPFKDKTQTFRSIGMVAPASVLQIVVLKKSGVQSVDDLRGKKFSPGPLGSMCYRLTTSFLKQAGVYKDIKIQNITMSEQITYLADGKIDGYAVMGSTPNPSISEIATMKPISVLNFESTLEKIDFFENNPFAVKHIIRAGTYKGVEYEVVSFGDPVPFVANKDVDENVVYEVSKTLFSEQSVKYLKTVHRSLREMEAPNPTRGLIIPLHPGAKRMWEEKGIPLLVKPLD
jgi:hypothetical protein